MLSLLARRDNVARVVVATPARPRLDWERGHGNDRHVSYVDLSIRADRRPIESGEVWENPSRASAP
jgi:hypothetical protein